MTIHVDYRPESLDDFVGNLSLKKSLKNILESEKMPRTFLFIGPSGCGKTTLANIICNYFGVHDFDISKINSSNNRGIDTARTIIENCKYKPMRSKYKIFILDEVHKTTNDFQNAMLEILENPPSYIIFILCTTDPDKLLKTIKTRCATFQVQKLKKKIISNYLKTIIEKNELNVIDEGPDLIAENAEGSMRNALIYLNMINNVDKIKTVTNLLNKSVDDKAQIIDLCRALIQGKKWNTISKLLQTIGDDPEKVRQTVLSYCTTILLKENNPQAALIIDCFKEPFFNSGKAGLVYACYMSNA